MDEFIRYELMMEALAELKPEIEAAYGLSSLQKTQPTQALPSLHEVLDEFGIMPPEALFLGVASDGLPVLLNLHDPVPGPILIAGDAGTGKTTLLQTIALAAGTMHQPQQLQFGALTSHPDEWSGFENIPNCVGVFPFYHQSSEDFILSLASWAHGNKSSRQSILLEKYAEAVLLYQRSIELFASDKDKAVTWNRLGNVYRRLNDYDNAIACYQRADELDPNNATLSQRLRFSLLGSLNMETSASLAV